MLIRTMLMGSAMRTMAPEGVDGGAPPAAPAAPPAASETPTGGIPPSGDPPAAAPAAGDPPAAPAPAPAAPDPVAEAAAAAATAAAVVPETADGYALNIPDALKGALTAEAMAVDPAIVALREHYKAQGRSQGEFDRLFEALGVLQDKGVLQQPIDFKAETAKLGDNGAARQKEVETFGQALKARGDIDDAEFGELMSLAPTAAGVSLIEKLRKMSGAGEIKPPGGEVKDPNADSPAQAEAKALAKDPKYGNDKRFTQEADEKWKAAFS